MSEQQTRIQELQKAIEHIEALPNDVQALLIDKLTGLREELATLVTAEGDGATAVGPRGVHIGGHMRGNIQTGDIFHFHFATAEPSDEEKRHELEAVYWSALYTHCNLLPVASLGGDVSTSDPARLDQVYVALDTKTEVPLENDETAEADDNPPAAMKGDKKTRRLTALEATMATGRMVLLGKPGSGKSSFVRQLVAWQAAAHQGGRDLPADWEPLFPLLTVLRELAPRLAELELDGLSTAAQTERLLTAVHDQWAADLQTHGVADLADYLTDYLHDGRVLLIFDGLDEVPHRLRGRVQAAVRAILGRYHQVRQIIVTSRIRSYDDDSRLAGFTDHRLAPFSTDKIRAFVIGWYEAQVALGAIPAKDAPPKTRDLQQAATRPALQELAANPMLLTTMAIIHQKEVGLPHERVRLYAQAVEVLLNRWQKHKGLKLPAALETVLGERNQMRRLMERVAYEAHLLQYREEGADLTRGRLLTLLEAEPYLGRIALADAFLDYVDQRAGLLVGRGGTPGGKPHTYGFPHRTFQEYLAGCYLVGDHDRESPARRYWQLAEAGDYWYLAAQLGGEELFYNRRSSNGLLDLAYELCPTLIVEDAVAARAAVWSAHMAVTVGVETVARDPKRNGGTAYLERLRTLLVPIMRGETPQPLTLLERAEAGRHLARVGDPRSGVGLDENGLPDIVWGKPVPAGRYTIGGDPDALFGFDEQQVAIDVAYQLARYPVTYAQFRAFVEADDYHNERWWRGMPEEQKDFRGENHVTKEISEQAFKYGNHPRESVAWYQAIAFCRWLSHKLGYEVTLPHDYEWEVAARYNDGRKYPWGDEFAAEKANTDEGGIGQTTAVGLYPDGRQPELDLYDISGNVWEWCLNKYYNPTQVDVDDSGDYRALRGGSWDYLQDLARAASRFSYVPSLRSYFFGFRLVRRSPSHVH